MGLEIKTLAAAKRYINQSLEGAGTIQGKPGKDGNGIVSITKDSSTGKIDTYKILFTDNTSTTFTVTNATMVTDLSQLNNDIGFITNTVNNLVNYYTKTETYSKDEISKLLQNIGLGLSVMVVATLPTVNISATTIYLINEGSDNNSYEQWMYIGGIFASLGSTTINLSSYYTKGNVDNLLLGYVTASSLTTILAEYVKKTELASVATSGSYNDLKDLPTIPTTEGLVTKKYVDDAINNIHSGGGGSVDSSMSDTSTNPVQNKVAKKYTDDQTKIVDDKVESIKKYQKYVNTKLDYCYLSFDLSKVAANSNKTINITAGTITPFDYMFNGNMEYDIIVNHSIKLKANKTYKLTATLTLGSETAFFGFRFYNITDSEWLTTFASTQKIYNFPCNLNHIITPDHDIEVCVRVSNIMGNTIAMNASGNWAASSVNVGLQYTYNQCYFIAEEINRAITIDPVEHVNTESGIEDTPVGHIISYMGNYPPKHYVGCFGQELSISEYPYLAQHFKQEFGKCNYFGGNGTTHFKVPNLCGEFLRGTGTNSHNIQGNGCNVGRHEDATQIPYIGCNLESGDLWVQTNTPNTPSSMPEYGNSLMPLNTDNIRTNQTTNEGLYFRKDGIITNSTNISTYTTHPTYTAVLYCIKCEPTYYCNLSGIEYYSGGTDNIRVIGRYSNSGVKYNICRLALYKRVDTKLNSSNKLYEGVIYINKGIRKYYMSKVIKVNGTFHLKNGAGFIPLNMLTDSYANVWDAPNDNSKFALWLGCKIDYAYVWATIDFLSPT